MAKSDFQPHNLIYLITEQTIQVSTAHSPPHNADGRKAALQLNEPLLKKAATQDPAKPATGAQTNDQALNNNKSAVKTKQINTKLGERKAKANQTKLVMQIMDVKKTVTSIFIVPTLKLKKEYLNNNNFINGYIADLRKDIQYDDALYLLFKPENLDRFREFVEDEYEHNHMLIDDYDYEDGFVVLVYKINKKYDKDLELIMKGKYSKTSDNFQSLFPKVVKIMKNGLHRDEISIQFRVFKKTQDLREYWENKLDVSFDEEMEVWGGFNLLTESLDLDKVKQELYENA